MTKDNKIFIILFKGGALMDYRALDVANYVVYHALKIGKAINHLQLQKIMYYLEAIWLTQNGESLFTDDIEMWRLGPVVPSVYHEYKIFGSSRINSVPKELQFSKDGTFGFSYEDFDPDVIEKDTKDFINPYIEKLLKCDGFYLVNRTHEHIMWKKHEPDIKSGVKGLKYNKFDMKHFFESHKEELEFLIQ